MPDDDIDSYWDGLRPRREPTTTPAERIERASPSRVSVIPFEETISFIVDPQLVDPPLQQAGRPPYGIIDRHNSDAGLGNIRSLRQTLHARARERSTQSQAQAVTGVDPDQGLRREVEAVLALRESEAIRPERRRPSDTWAEFEPLSTREQRIRNHAYMDGLRSREEPNGSSTLNRLMASFAALGITGSVGQERLSNGNRAVWFLIEPVPNEVPHFRIGTRVTQYGGLEVTVEFPEE